MRTDNPVARTRAEASPEKFLAAWKRGIALVGERHFEVAGATVATATDKNQLRPRLDLIAERLPQLPHGQALLLAAMASFFDAHGGQRLLERLECPNVCDIAARLDYEGRDIVADLLAYYAGW